jgi:hypothetical protein
MYYRTVRKLRGLLFWTTILAGLLWIGLPQHVPGWAPLALAVAWLLALGYGIFHVAISRRQGWRCPTCEWVPYAIDAWKCKGCGQRLDVFASLGVCPRCGHQHEEAMCLRCRHVAPNRMWHRGIV